MYYHVVYDGNCNLCVTFVQLLATFDRGNLFDYTPMQERESLIKLHVTEQDCQQGMILIDAQQIERRWQGSEAAEEIIRLLPTGEFLMFAYRRIPRLKELGDFSYQQIRDNRYRWFGERK